VLGNVNTLGSGLIKRTALALICSSTAGHGELALGNRGAAGLAWVGMSTFGCTSVIRACVAGSTPNSLRHTLGVRNALSQGHTEALMCMTPSGGTSVELMAHGVNGASVGLVIQADQG
jgi:hypothetical protein